MIPARPSRRDERDSITASDYFVCVCYYYNQTPLARVLPVSIYIILSSDGPNFILAHRGMGS